MYKAVVGKDIGFDHFCVVEENIVASDRNTDFGVVQGTNDLTIAQVVRVCNFVQGMSAVRRLVYRARTKQETYSIAPVKSCLDNATLGLPASLNACVEGAKQVTFREASRAGHNCVLIKATFKASSLLSLTV